MSMVLRLFFMSAAAALLVMSQGAAADPSPPSHQKVVATTFTVIQDMAQNVAGDKLKVVSITPPGAEIHDYEPTPQDIIKARGADLVLWNGLGLERWFERFYGNLKSTPVAVLSEGIKPISLREGQYEGRPNPHGWISPANAAIYVNNIRDAFIKLDPANAETYRVNAERYNQRIAALNTPIAEQLARIPEARRQLATCEGAFSYLARDYGFKELYLWAVNSEEEGTPRQVRHVVDAVRQNKVPVVFCESTVSDRAMKQVASEAGAAFGGVLYVDSLSKKDGPVPDYLSMLRHNANTIVKGFGVDSK
ncbi:metal ABC transporter substrate-binding protein [Carnimonas nigrificans]|uniref:metal ABC transporter substrate-binding protein n=1 Tax=Carnimonas nigrificans TaxID=64323 RepID=UPI000471C855|nr:metal ABC transporter substrate-binding protein [Carnimonas nigrificans]